MRSFCSVNQYNSNSHERSQRRNLQLIRHLRLGGGIGMGALCSCCTTGMTGDEEDGLLGDANSARSDEARRKAAEAALRRAGALAQRARPPPRSSSSNTRPSSISNNMRWEGG
jgi:hypothetical protein